MKHEFDQAQVRELARIAALGADRSLRASALSSAVAFHSEVSGMNASENSVLATAVRFEEYIKDGRVE